MPRGTPWQSPPGDATPIDQRHPLAAGLKGLWLFADAGARSQFFSLAGPRTGLAVATPAYSLGASRFGGGVNVTGQSNAPSLTVTPDHLNVRNAITVAALVTPPAATSAFYGKMVGNGQDAAYTLSSQIGSNKTPSIRLWTSGGTLEPIIALDVFDGKPHTVVGTYNRVQAVTYGDGSPGTPVAGTGTINSSTAGFAIGDSIPGSGSNVSPGVYHLALVAARPWTAAEVRRFHNAPYELFEPSRRVWHFGIPAPTLAQAAPAGDVSAGTWTTDAGATTNLYQAIDEGPGAINDADYVRSQVAPTGASPLEVSLAALTDPARGDYHTLSYRGGVDAVVGGAMSLTVELRQGASALSTPASWTDPLGATLQRINHPLSQAQADAITDYSTLRLRFTASQAVLSTSLPAFVGAGTAQFTATNGQAIPSASPPNGNVGDALLAVVARNDGTAAPAAPSGWTNHATLTGVNGTALSVAVYYKYATSATGTSDALGALTFGTSTIARGAVVYRVAGSVGTGDPTVARSRLSVASTATTMSTTNITSTVANTLGLFLPVAVGVRGSTGTAVTNWAGSTVTVQTTTVGTDMTFGYATRDFPAAGSYLTPGITWAVNTTTGAGASLLLALAPAPVDANASRALVTWAQLEAPDGGAADDYPAYRPWLFRARYRELLAR